MGIALPAVNYLARVSMHTRVFCQIIETICQILWITHTATINSYGAPAHAIIINHYWQGCVCSLALFWVGVVGCMVLGCHFFAENCHMSNNDKQG